MSLDFILIPSCILIILFLLNRENKIYKRDQKAKYYRSGDRTNFFLKIIDLKKYSNIIKFHELREFSRKTIPTFFLKLICPNIVFVRSNNYPYA